MRIYRISVKKSVVKEVTENYTPRFDFIFNDKKRIIISMEQGWIKNVLSKLRNGETKTGSKYSIDPSLNYAYKEGDKSNRPIKIGRIIQLELGKDYLNEWSRQKENSSGQNKYSIIISRSPVDIVRMSDFYDTHSCHAPNREYFACAKQEAINGGAIAYLVENSDLQGLTDEELQSDDLFFDEGRNSGKMGLKPKSRLRINKYVNQENEELAVPLDSMYGLRLKPFYDTVSEFMYSKQQDAIKKLKQNKNLLNKYKRVGGTYRDLNDNRIMDDFFKENMELKGNLETESDIKTQIEQWTQEISAAIDNFNERLQVFENVVAEVNANINHEEEDGDVFAGLSIWAHGEITVFADVDLGNIEELFGPQNENGESTLDLDSIIHEIKWRKDLSVEEKQDVPDQSKYLDKFGDLLLKLYNASNNILSSSASTIRMSMVKNDDGLEICFKFDFDVIDNPDEFSRTLEHLSASIIKNYYQFSSSVLNLLSANKIIVGVTNPQDDQYLSLLDATMFLSNIPQSSMALAKNLYAVTERSTELVNSLYNEFHSSIIYILVNVYNKKNQMTFDFFNDTKVKTYSKKIPDYILHINEYPIYRNRKTDLQVFRYFDWSPNQNELKILIPSSETYNIGKEAMRNFLKYMPLIAKNFTPKCESIFKNFTNSVALPENKKENKEEATACTWFGLYKQTNANENNMMLNSDLTIEESDIALDIINTCIDQEGFFDRIEVIKKIKQSGIHSDIIIEKIINAILENRPITPKMIERVKMKINSSEIIGPEIVKWISEYYDLPKNKAWELAGLAAK